MFVFYLIFIIFVTNGYAKIAPDFINPCHDTSPQCLKKAAQEAIPGFVKGLPQFGIPQLEPFTIVNLSLPLSGVAINFKTGKVYGLKTCIIDDINLQLEKRHIDLDFYCNLTIVGEYSAEGKLFSFGIHGEGPAEIKLTNIRIQPHFNLKYNKNKSGVTHVLFKDYTYKFDYGDKVTFDIKNIFKGNKALSDTIVEFMNQEWKSVVEECGKPIVDYAVQLGAKYAGKFFGKIPYSELLDVKLPQQ